MARQQDNEQNFNEQQVCGTPLPPGNVPSSFGSSVNPLVSYSPSISYTSVTLYNSVNNRQTFIEIKSNFEELITGQNTLRWYDDSRFLNYLRIRCVVSLSEVLSRDIDAVQQRMNEYIATSQSETPQQYLARLSGELSPSQAKLVGEGGPFNFSGIVPRLRTNPYLYYISDANPRLRSMSDAFIYDVPASDLLIKDYEGSLSVSRVQDVSAGRRVGDENNRNYVLEKTFLKDMVFKIGEEQEYFKNNISHLSIYTFAYFDIQSYSRDNNLNNNPNTVLEAGCGFVNPGCFMGDFHVFNNTMDVPSEVIDSPDANILYDLRLEEETNIDRFNTILYDSFIRSLQKTTIGRGFANIIKDKNHYSELWLSRAQDDNVRYMFAFDMRAYLIQNSKFPFLYLSPDSYQELVSGGEFIQSNENNPGAVDERTKILDYIMRRRENFQDAYESNNDLPTILRKKPKGPDYYAPEVVLPKPKENKGIFLIDNPIEQMQNMSSIVFYEGMDNLKKEITSQHVCRYQYNVEFLVKDSANLLIQRCAEKLRSAEKKVEEIHNLIINSPTGKTVKNTSIEHGVGLITITEEPAEVQRMPDGLITDGIGLFDYKTLTRKVPLEFIGVEYNGQVQTAKSILEQQIETYINCLRFTGVATMVSLNAIRNQLISAINFPDLAGIDQTAKTIQFFAAMLEGVSNDLNPGDRFHEGGKEKSILKTRGFCQRKLVILKSKNFFDNIFDLGKTIKTGYEYLVDGDNNSDQSGLIRISKSQHTNRSREEFYKYFDFAQPDLNRSTAERGTSESFIRGEAPFLPGYSDSSYLFYTPRNILINGKATINQPKYKVENTLKTNYNINRYAELFGDMINVKNLSKYLGKIYTLSEGETTTDTKNQQTYNLAIDNLLREHCFIEQGFEPLKNDLKPKLFNGEPSSRENSQDAYRLLPYVFGGGLDTTTVTLEYFSDTENSIKKQTSEDKSKGNDNKIKETTKEEGLPIKLAFSILGELTLEKDGIGRENYEELMFNSLKNMVIRFGLDQDNIKHKIENDFSGFPNQVKSMLVLGCTNENLIDPLGNGFQVTRTMLDDLDPSTPDKTVPQYIVSRFPEITDTKDPMKTYAKFLAFWMNYKQLIRVEYLAGFGRLDPSHFIANYRNIGAADMMNNPIFVKTKLPIWKPITTNILESNQNKNFLCRLAPIPQEEVYSEGLSTAMDYFSMPIYNRYFVLDGTPSDVFEPASPTFNVGGTVAVIGETPNAGDALLNVQTGGSSAQQSSTLGGLVGSGFGGQTAPLRSAVSNPASILSSQVSSISTSTSRLSSAAFTFGTTSGGSSY